VSEFNYRTGKEVCKECRDADQLYAFDHCLSCLRKWYKRDPKSFSTEVIANIKNSILVEASIG